MKDYTKQETLCRHQPGHWQNLLAAHSCVVEIQRRLNSLKWYPKNCGACWPVSIERLKGCAQVFIQWAAKYPPLPLP